VQFVSRWYGKSEVKAREISTFDELAEYDRRAFFVAVLSVYRAKDCGDFLSETKANIPPGFVRGDGRECLQCRNALDLPFSDAVFVVSDDPVRTALADLPGLVPWSQVAPVLGPYWDRLVIQ
jgi:hypothetical protein